MSDTPADIEIPEEALERLRSASSIFALTGAGVSAESGIPTFRAPGTGLWSRYDISQVATPEAWQRNPSLVWSWYSLRRKVARRAQPNPAHWALAQLERHAQDFTLATQNVDGLHQRAGSQNIAELHGSLFRFRCSREGAVVAWEDPDDENPEALAQLERGELTTPPPCPDCGAPLRPDIVWFGEVLPRPPFEVAALAAQGCDVCLVVGTSALVQPAKFLPLMARSKGAYLIEINPEATEMTQYAGWSAREQAGLALPALLRALDISADV